MSENLLEKHEPVVIEMAKAYLDTMELELAKKYKNNDYEILAGLTDEQYTDIRTRNNIPSGEFAEIYTDFQRMQPTEHLRRVMSAFTASGGSVEVEPVYDEDNERLSVSFVFIIDDKEMESIEGLSELESLLLRRDAMLQIDNVLSGSDPEAKAAF